ncbi:thiamine diphosphokinase [candidate division KSB3 bacterium]|uniref:Thiamine diphosphokinase n=1 Tax=candidate division KSB3 bacterium TaxID=2044937 RepID=A0A9D5Q6R9_9BACT|nr:thiamine diphosphokinase [candidate division KSB3 bacterium]MBD3325527.1 thiamine diphosphokinase [candidate division KSB3 bacterium]
MCPVKWSKKIRALRRSKRVKNDPAARAIIFVNGELHAPEAVRPLIGADDYIIAVNGGTAHALRLQVVPHVIIGDLDSLDSAEEARVRSERAEIQRFPSRKDETDLELALRHAIDQDVQEILLLAAVGGRLDQSFANICLLMLPELQGRDVKIIEGSQTAFVIRDEATIQGTPGDTVSIVPIGGDAVGVSNAGLEWPLNDAVLPLGTTHGLSNVMRGEQATIRVREGMLLCIVIRHG